MVVPGKDCAEQVGIEDVAAATVRCLRSAVPASLTGIVFLSGGQSDTDATAHLNAINQTGAQPWPLSFSYGRAMQSAALQLRSEEHTSELQSLMRISYAVFCLKKKKQRTHTDKKR